MATLLRTILWSRFERNDLLIELGIVCGLVVSLTSWFVGQGGLLGSCMPPILFFVLGLAIPIVRGRGHWYQGVSGESIGRDLALLAGVLLIAFSLLYVGLKAVQSFAWEVPLMEPPIEGQWVPWAVHQMTHVALPEEVFFRGYLLCTILLFCQKCRWSDPKVGQTVAVLGSALIFGIFHAVVWESGFALLTFFPGVLMGWLFLRTRSLIVPVLFHAMANVGYAVAVSIMF
jgi:membrane protease YdiL (CAAX protease family)